MPRRKHWRKMTFSGISLPSRLFIASIFSMKQQCEQILGKKTKNHVQALFFTKCKTGRDGGGDQSGEAWQERCLQRQDAPCSSSAVAAGWERLLRRASAWPDPRPSYRSTSTAPPGDPADETSARHSPPDGLCQCKHICWTYSVIRRRHF